MNRPRLFNDTPADRRAYEEHLERTGSAAHAAKLDDPSAFVLGIGEEGRLFAHLSVRLQPLEHRVDEPLTLLEQERRAFTEAYPPGLLEGFVCTFDVEEEQRRLGLGSALQLAALEECRRRGAHQLRSWSSLDRTANFALKLKLGFAVHPGHYYLPARDRWVRGAYFIKSV